MTIFFAAINVFVLTIVAYILWKKSNTPLRTWFWASLFLHVASGIFIGLLYQHYYSQGDTFQYFQDACQLSKVARQNFFNYLNFLWNNSTSEEVWQALHYHQPRALFFTKIVSIANLLSYDNYWISSLYFSFVSFFAAWKFSVVLHNWLPNKKVAIVFSFLLFPSCMVWSSGIVKESIALAAVFYLCTVLILIYKKLPIKWRHLVLSIVSTWLLYSIKYYYLAVLLPVLSTALFYQNFIYPRMRNRSFAVEIIVWLLVFFTLILLVTPLHPNLYPNRFLWVMYNNYLDFVSFSNSEDVMLFPTLQESWISLFLNSPWALVSGLFRPFIWEAGNSFQLLASLENLLLLTLTLTALPSLFTLHKTTDRILIFSAIMYCIILCTFLTISTPNFGTLIRYRVGFLPFIVFLVTVSNPVFNQTVTFLQTYCANLVRRKS